MRSQLAGTAIPLLLVTLVAVLFSLSSWSGSIPWYPDSFFYQAQTLEVRGLSAEAARHAVFDGPVSAAARARELHLQPGDRQISDPAWVRFSAVIYRRRWVVPGLAAAIYPIAGARSLLDVSIVGYLLLAPLLFLLVRRLCGPVLSVTITAAVMALTPLRTFSFAPLTDSWGLFIETLCIAAGILAMKRGQAWLIPWTIAMLVLSFTRDSTLVLLIAALVLLIHRRTQRTLQLFVTGVVASIPAFAIFGAPLRTNLALKVANDHVPTPSQASTEAILHHYPGFVWALVKGDLAYVHHHPLVGLVFVAGLALLFLPSHPGADDEWAFLRAGVLGGVVSLLAIPHGSEGRLELVFVPFVACGLARFQRPINNALRRRPLAFASALARGRRSTV